MQPRRSCSYTNLRVVNLVFSMYIYIPQLSHHLPQDFFPFSHTFSTCLILLSVTDILFRSTFLYPLFHHFEFAYPTLTLFNSFSSPLFYLCFISPSIFSSLQARSLLQPMFYYLRNFQLLLILPVFIDLYPVLSVFSHAHSNRSLQSPFSILFTTLGLF